MEIQREMQIDLARKLTVSKILHIDINIYD